MAAPAPSLVSRFLFKLANTIFSHRQWFLYPQLVLAVDCVFYTVRHLEFHTSRDSLVGGEKEYYHQYFLDYRAEFPGTPDLVVVVESEQLEKNRQFVERLEPKLLAATVRVPVRPGALETVETNLFRMVFIKGDFKTMGPKALLFVPTNGLAELQRTLREYQRFLMQFTRTTNLVSLFDLVNTQIRTARDEDNAANRSLVKALPSLERILAQASAALGRSGNPPSPGLYSLFEGGQEAQKRMYLTFAEGKIFLVTAQARTEALGGVAVQRMRQLVAETQREVPGLNVGLTGMPVLEYDEMQQSQKDSTRATIVSLLIVALIFIYGYNETGRPLKATFCLLIGLAYTMGFTTLVVGHLNILTITFVPILIGLAIDFGVHLITRYEEELRHGRSERVALEKAIVYTGMGIFTGAFTTAGAFFAMAATDFVGIKEMGVICGGGMLVCLVPMMTLLPALLLRGKQNALDHELGPMLEGKEAVEVDKRARVENFWLRRPVTVMVVIFGLSAACLVPARKVIFDYNLLHMQSAGLPAVIFQDKLIQSSKRSVLFCVMVATNLTQATNLYHQLTNRPTVEDVDTMALYLTEDAGAKLQAVGAVKRALADIQFAPVDLRPVNVTELDRTLIGLHGYLGIILKRVDAAETNLLANLTSLRETVSELRRRLLLNDRKESAHKLAEYQQNLFNDVGETFVALRQQDDRAGMRAEDLPEFLRQRFVGVTGRYLLQIYPKKNVWGRAAQEEFVKDLRTVDPRLTGTPVELFEYTTLLRTSFQEAAKYSLIAIALLVFIHFRKVSCVVLALIPVGVGFLWMVGLMGLFGIPFNPANVMTLPLIIGIGVTNGIHILNRFAEEQHPSILARSTGKAVLVSGLTTIAGFGSLILAQHRGIQSLGYIMATGTATCMFVGLTFLPAILNFLNARGWTITKIKRSPAPSTLGGEEPKSETAGGPKN